jgi:hypothetical protein
VSGRRVAPARFIMNRRRHELKDLIPSGRRLQRAGHPWQAEDRVAILGWISMAVVVVAALPAASYGALGSAMCTGGLA